MYLLIGLRALLKKPLLLVRVCLSFVLSFVLSATLGLNISETRPDSGMPTMDSLYKLVYGYRLRMLPMTSHNRMTS